MVNFIISTGQPIGAGAYQPEIEEVYVSYEPNGAITDLTVGVTFDSVKNEFVVPVDTSIFTFKDNGVEMMGLFVDGEWVFIDHVDVSYEPNGAITDLTVGVTFKIVFDIPDGVDFFNFKDNGVATMGSLVNGEWVFTDHFDVSYEPNGVITVILPSSVTFDGAKNEFVVPINIPAFNFNDNGVAMIGSLVNGEWVFIDHFDVSYEPNGAIAGIVPPNVTFDSVKDEFVVPVDVSSFNFDDNGVAMIGLFANGEWVFVDHVDVSYEPNGTITDLTNGVTFDSAKNEFVVPANTSIFNFKDNGVTMIGSLVNDEWVFALQ